LLQEGTGIGRELDAEETSLDDFWQGRMCCISLNRIRFNNFFRATSRYSKMLLIGIISMHWVGV
jgi:hypothetical protein